MREGDSLVVVVDSREPQLMVKKLRDELGEEEVKINKLNYGDYMIYGAEDNVKYIIERKTLRDLKGSIQSGRMWKQLSGLMMYDGSFKKILLIEGMPYLEIKRGRLSWTRWISWKTAFLEGYKDLVIYESAKMDETVYFLKKLNERVKNKAEGEGKSIADKISFSIPNLDERGYLVGESEEGEIVGVLVGLKGVGVKTALKLLENFGTLRDVFEASETDLEAVVGKKLGSRIWMLANRKVEIAKDLNSSEK